MTGRRLRIVPVHSVTLGMIFRGRREEAITSDWPDDAVVVGADWNIDRSILRLLVESSTFDEVPEGFSISDWTPTFTAHSQTPEAKQLLDVIERMRKEDPS